jgi:predicted nucleic acid-binding protein
VTDCLDSWAVLRWLEGTEPAASRVEASLASRPIMSWINLGEVSYLVERLAGPKQAREVVRELRRQLTMDLPSEARVLEASHLKASHPMAYADAFAVATAVAHNANLLTGDPEILGGDPSWPTTDLRT